MTKPITWTPDAQSALERINGRIFCTVTEAAALLDVDARTMRGALKRGDIPGLRTGSTWRVPTSWLREKAQITQAEEACDHTKPERP